MDVPAGPRKSDYLYTNFLPNFPPVSIPFSKEKHPIWIKLGAFYNNLQKIHPIYVIWAPSSLMKTPRSLYQISRKGAPKGRHTYVYHVNVRTPPPGAYNVCVYNPRNFCFYSFSVSVSFNFETQIMSTCMSTSRSKYMDMSTWKKHADHSTTYVGYLEQELCIILCRNIAYRLLF